MSKLVVVIVSWNTCDLTIDCLRSLFNDLRGIDNEVWVVDNNSSDSSTSMIKQEFPQVNLIENSENVGFARANNQALTKACGDYYLLLNPDTIVPEGLMNALLDFMQSHPEVSAAAPNQRNNEGIIRTLPKKLPSARSELRECLQYHFFPIDHLINFVLSKSPPAPNPISKSIKAEILSAACLIIRKEVFEKIGYLAEDYFLFSEENDYFTRMKLSNLESYFLPHIEIIHLVGKSRQKLGNVKSQTNFLCSRIKYYNKFHKNKVFIIKAIYWLFFSWSILMATIIKLIKRQKECKYLDFYKVLMRALKEAA